ncbi:MAG: GxxExxY protein [Acidobacteria bacterium]|nr:GxxExxY protein [Acidobacteriota bacterium]
MSHEEYEGSDVRSGGYRMRLPSPLSEDAERAMSETIACAIRVHRELGPGFLELIYRKAMYLELEAAGMSYESERVVQVSYRGALLGGQRVNLIVESAIVVELKAVARFDEVHLAQVMSYLRTTGLRGGLLINFNVPVLRRGLKRIVR